MTDPLLEVRGIDAGYGHVPVLHDVSIVVPRGKMVAVLGRNGAGKSTLLKAISGLLTPTAGEVLLDGEPIAGRGAVAIAHAGLQHVVEGHRVFGTHTVRENLDVAVYRTGIDEAEQARRRERVLDLFPDLTSRMKDQAAMLSGGQQQMLAIGQALMREPEVLLVDEPSLGLAPIVVGGVFDALRRLRDDGMTIVLVEQVVNRTLSIVDHGYMLQQGRVAVEGSADQLRGTAALQEAYLGVTNAPDGGPATAANGPATTG